LKKRLKIRDYLRWIVELTALGLVIFLTIQNKLQMWFLLFAAGILVSIFAGRYFCGWICPMNTMFRFIDVFYRKLKIKRAAPPVFLSGRLTRFLILALFIGAMVIIRKRQIPVNMLLYLMAFSVLVTLFFEESFWHKSLCPFGTILSFTSRKSLINMSIDEEVCISCGLCQKVCPPASIQTLDNKKRQNTVHECLMCYECVSHCPVKTCTIGTHKGKN